MRTLVLSAFLSIAATPLLAQPTAGPFVRVLDGDSYLVLLEGHPTAVRLDRADTPEQPPRARCRQERDRAAKATAFVVDQVARREVAVFPTGQRDRYHRPIVRVTVDGLDLADLLRWNALAEAFPLGYHPDWCGPPKSPATPRR